MRKLSQKIILILTILLCSIPSTAVIPDIFHNPDGPDRGSFFMRVKDSLNNKKISTKKRRLTIQLFFLSKFYDEIDQTNRIDLSAAFNRSLRTNALLKKGKETQASKQGLKFNFKDISSEDRSKKYNRVSFESEKVIISDAQRINFNFDQKGFADYLDVSIDENGNYSKRIRYSPLKTELKNFNAEQNAELITISGTFLANEELNLSSAKYKFEFKDKSKKYKAFATRGEKKLKLEANLAENTFNPVITKIEDEDLEYQISIPVKLSPKKKSDRKSFKDDKTFEVNIPVLIELETNSALDFEIRGLVKEQFINFLDSSN